MKINLKAVWGVLLFGTWVVSGHVVQAQDGQKSQIINSNEYYWGESCASNMQEASDKALAQLTSQIAVHVTNSFENKLTAEESEAESKIEEKTTSVVQTYSSATIKNAQTIKNPAACGINVFHYIPKQQISRIFESRKQLVRDIYGKALDYEAEGNYAYAIKWYYYSIVLMNSIPEQELFFGSKNLYAEVPGRISEMIQQARFEVLTDDMVLDDERELVFDIYVGEQKAKTLDFSFWDGSNQVHVQTRDGKAYVQLYGSSVNFRDLDVYVKYDYYQQRGEIKEVGELWALVNKPSFPNHKKLRINQPVAKEPVVDRSEEFVVELQAVNQLDMQTNSLAEMPAAGMEDSAGSGVTNFGQTAEVSLDMEEKDPEKELDPDAIMEQTKDLHRVFNKSRTETTLPGAWSSDQFLAGKLTQLDQFNNLKLVGSSASANINETYEGWELRQIPGTTSYKTLNMQSSEYVIPDFDEDGNLSDVNFGIMEDLYEKFQEQAQYGKDWKERQVIIKFMEKYRTAYLTRDMNQIDAMFAEEAVIIVGRLMQKDQSAGQKYRYEQMNSGQPNVEYLRYTKEEYLKRQKRLFATKPDIYLGFSTFDIIRKNNQPGIYGISLRQHYNSTGYSDEGYLFLLVDFNDDQPKIYVRSWQPQEWSRDALIELANFNVNF